MAEESQKPIEQDKGTDAIEAHGIVSNVILNVTGPVFNQSIPDIVNVVGQWTNNLDNVVLEVAKEVVVHLAVHAILSLAYDPADPALVAKGELGAVIRDRVRRAKLQYEHATQQAPASSSRELIALREIILRSDIAPGKHIAAMKTEDKG
jgi:hypothetical protein